MVGSKKETHLILKHDLNSCVKSHFKRLILRYKLFQKQLLAFTPFSLTLHLGYSSFSFHRCYVVPAVYTLSAYLYLEALRNSNR